MTDLKPYRKTRSIARKPKFQQSSPDSSHLNQMGTQLTLFPLHPENLFEEKELHDLFDQEAGGGATTLNGLLGASSTSSSSSSEDDALSPSLTCAYGGGGHDSTLEQTALRHKERVLGEEKWVLYSEVAAVPMMEMKGEAVISSSSIIDCCCHAQGLSLKLDYDEILNAWSDKGSLYIGECPQTVPDQAQDGANGFVDVGCMANARLWSVPDDGIVREDSKQGKVAHREARVMRYKEKRQSRLFSKRIRYEVRKLNAEKRPRMKGRFVKRKSEA